MKYNWKDTEITVTSLFEEDATDYLKNVKYEILDEFMAIEIGLRTTIYGADIKHIAFNSPKDGRDKQAIIITVKYVDSWNDIYFRVDRSERLTRDEIKEIVFKYFDLINEE